MGHEPRGERTQGAAGTDRKQRVAGRGGHGQETARGRRKALSSRNNYLYFQIYVIIIVCGIIIPLTR